MKYIRTENGVYEEEKYNLVKVFVSAIEEEQAKIMPITKTNINIIKQADTIEELCDEFIYTGSKFSFHFRTKGYGNWDGTRIESDKDMHKELQSKGCVFYGAIWTDKGLIYVAKMNEKGELELL